MGTKLNPGKYDCYASAMPDEPMFVLLARDPNAPALVEAWADNRRNEIIRGKRPMGDFDMTDEAKACASNMRKWREANEGKWRK